VPPGNATEAEICDWCITYIRRTVDDPTIPISLGATFAEMGLDSATSAYFIVELEEWLGTELDPEVVFDHPTIAELARFIVTRPGSGNAGAA
jgi:acyl carrier protein